MALPINSLNKIRVDLLGKMWYKYSNGWDMLLNLYKYWNGQATGPFDVSVLTNMAVSGQFTAESLVWKAGMAAWEKAGNIDELKGIFGNVMPPIPTEK